MRGVDMFRNALCASEKTELSNAPAAWAFDPRRTASPGENNGRDCPMDQSCNPPIACEPLGGRSPEGGPGVIFACHTPPRAAPKNNSVLSGRLKLLDACLQTELSDFRSCMDELVL